MCCAPKKPKKKPQMDPNVVSVQVSVQKKEQKPELVPLSKVIESPIEVPPPVFVLPAMDESTADRHMQSIMSRGQQISELNIGVAQPTTDARVPILWQQIIMIKKFNFATTFVRANRKAKVVALKEEFTKNVTEEDIHSRRLNEALNQQSDGPSYYKFDFPQQLKRLDLSGLNQVDFNNDANINVVPELIAPLNEIVKNPGVYHMDSFNWHPNYQHIRNVKTCDMSRFDGYVPPSRDTTLQAFAKEANLKYIVSTSTFSSLMCHLFYLISGFKSPDFTRIYEEYPDEPRKYMISLRKPTSNFLHKIDKGLYALDSDPGLFEYDVVALMNAGKVLERQLTQSEEEFTNRYMNTEPTTYPPIEDFHRFMKVNDRLCLRSQIDCRSTINGKTFVYEIKTRAACPIRYDYINYLDYLDYQITQFKGLHSSFEREYYDLIRGAFIKWAFQIKIGRMDGAFVAYHNLQQIQGFEYIKATEIYKRVFGTEEFGEAIFNVGSRVATTLFDEIIDSIQEEYQTLKIGVYAQNYTKKLIIFVELFKTKDYLNLVNRELGMQDEYDYYEKMPLTNTVLKYEMLLQPDVNGIPIQNPVNFRKGDQLGIKYQVRALGKAEFKDYMNFLHDCYKHEELNIDLNYSGAWLKSLE